MSSRALVLSLGSGRRVHKAFNEGPQKYEQYFSQDINYVCNRYCQIPSQLLTLMIMKNPLECLSLNIENRKTTESLRDMNYEFTFSDDNDKSREKKHSQHKDLFAKLSWK